MVSPIIVLGSGLSGLSAATELAARGERVVVLEQHGYAGGRTRSFIDATTGDVVDNGQHLLMGCYAATREYLQRIGSSHLATLQPRLKIPYLRPGHPPTIFTVSPLPSPFHLLGGLLQFSAIPRSERAALVRFGRTLLSLTPEREKDLDLITADEWLRQLGQGAESRRYLWDVITIGALNEHPQNVSALLLARVLRTAFSGRRTNASLLIPNAGLSELLVDPAVKHIEARGGFLRLNTAVVELVLDGDRACGVRVAGGEIVEGKAVILAVPWYDADRIASQHLHHSYTPLLASSPIISLQLWFDRPISSPPLAAVLDSTIQWIFTKPSRPHHLSIVISAAGQLVDWLKDDLLILAIKELGAVLPAVKEAKLVHSLVLKEKRATFVPRPGLEAIRPAAETTVNNLFLAGDWTATGYPATIEGAVLSGEQAARSALGDRGTGIR